MGIIAGDSAWLWLTGAALSKRREAARAAKAARPGGGAQAPAAVESAGQQRTPASPSGSLASMLRRFARPRGQ